jgi:hypothetical protein
MKSSDKLYILFFSNLLETITITINLFFEIANSPLSKNHSNE